MIKTEYYKIILNNLSTAVLLADGVLNADGKIVDFKVSYMNESFLKLTKDLLKENELLSEFKTRLTPAVAWKEIALECIEQKHSIPITFQNGFRLP